MLNNAINQKCQCLTLVIMLVFYAQLGSCQTDSQWGFSVGARGNTLSEQSVSVFRAHPVNSKLNFDGQALSVSYNTSKAILLNTSLAQFTLAGLHPTPPFNFKIKVGDTVLRESENIDFSLGIGYKFIFLKNHYFSIIGSFTLRHTRSMLYVHSQQEGWYFEKYTRQGLIGLNPNIRIKPVSKIPVFVGLSSFIFPFNERSGFLNEISLTYHLPRL